MVPHYHKFGPGVLSNCPPVGNGVQNVRGCKPGPNPKPDRAGAQSVGPGLGLANPALLSFSYQQFQIFCKIISFHFFQIRSFLSRLTIIIHRYFEEITFQYSSGRRRLYFCALRAGSGRAWAENSGPLRPLLSGQLENPEQLENPKLSKQIGKYTNSSYHKWTIRQDPLYLEG